jgi:RNA polymerase sigma-70 factor (ECF subfamily)
MEAFEALFKLYEKKALGTAYLIAGDKTIAEDIVQEAFIICFREIKNIKNPQIFNIWFYRLIVRVGWRMVSKYKKTLPLEKEPVNLDNLIGEELSLEQMVESKVTYMLVKNKIKTLNTKFKTVIILYYFNEMSIKEISKTLGCFEGTVKSRLYKARLLLKRELEQEARIDLNNKDLFGREIEINGI